MTKDDIVLTTILGSCVAACICDRDIGVGGINHFLLPGEGSAGLGGRSESYGVYLMEVLVNGLLKKGARRERLEAKLFGGARTMELHNDIGAKNAQFARRFLENEGIATVCLDIGGVKGRRIEYWPVSGRSRRLFMQEKTRTIAETPTIFTPAAQQVVGDVEFF